MINCTIVRGSEREHVDGFIEGTTRFVCVSEIDSAFLSILADQPCHMQVRVDEQDVLTKDLNPQLHQFALRELLQHKLGTKKTGIWPFNRITVEDQRLGFSVVIRQGNATGPVLATYEYSLLSCTHFESRFNHHLHLHEGRCIHELFTTDERATESANNCWNCNSPVKPGDVCQNCRCHQDQY